ncbi:MAG: hypothetical protein EBY17_02970 [Acidobacteriia bacterium]|nr:hypothetical protein [Terriglobia bacterium]
MIFAATEDRSRRGWQARKQSLLRETGEAIHRFRMIREADRVAVADFSSRAFTLEQGKFLSATRASISPLPL